MNLPCEPMLSEFERKNIMERETMQHLWIETFFPIILVLADKVMLKCMLKCSSTAGRTFENQGHWYCAYCFQICEMKNAMTVHLNTHSKVNMSLPLITKERQKNNSGNSRAARQAKIECPKCLKAHPHNKALQRHLRDQHTRKMEATISPGRHLKGACSVTRQSGHPNFDCIHLQSVQYPHPFEKPIDLCGESLEERVGSCFNWFSIKQKDICVAKGQQASELGSRLIFRFPCDKYGAHSRPLYFPIF